MAPFLMMKLPHTSNTSSPSRKAYWAVMSCIASVAFFAVLEMLYMTQYGIGIGGDSLYYIGAAVALMEGKGYATCFSGVPQPVVGWPPGFSICLAGLGQLMGDPSAAARWLNSVCFGINTWMVGWVILRYIGWYPVASILSSLFFAMHWRFLDMHAVAFSEPLFLSCSLIGFAVLLKYFETGSLQLLCASAAVFSLAMLTRIFGVTFIAAAALGLLILGNSPIYARFSRTAIFLTISLSPTAVFFVRNLALAGSITTVPTNAVCVPSSECAGGLVRFGFGLLWPYEYNFSPKTKWFLYGGWYGLMLTIVLQIILAFRRGNLIRPKSFAALTGLCICSYMALFGYLVFSNLECQKLGTMQRYLMPLMPFLLLFLGSLVLSHHVGDQPPISGSRLRVVTIGAAIMVMAGCAKIIWSCYPTRSVENQQFTSKSWRSSALVSFVRNLETNATIYANRQDALWFHTRRRAEALPPFYDMNNGTAENALSYSNTIANVRRQLEGRGGYILVFSNAYLHQAELQNSIIDSACRSAHRIQLTDGTVYAFRKP